MGYLLDDLEKTAFSLTNRYQGNQSVSEARKNYKKMAVGSDSSGKRIAYLKYRDEKAKADMAKAPGASAGRSKLEEKYISQGLTKEEAKLRAFRKDRAKKRMLLAGAAGAGIAAGVGAYKYHDYVTDKTIKKGKTLQNIRVGEDQYFDKDSPYYTAASNTDKRKYRGNFGTQFGGGHVTPVRVSQIEATEDLKIPSRKKTIQSFKESIGDDQEKIDLLKSRVKSSREEFKNIDPPWAKRQRLLRRADRKLSKGKVDKDALDASNMRFMDYQRKKDPEFADKIEKGLYKNLKDKGYHAIQDSHDARYSGYKAKSANILFNTKGKVQLKSDDVMTPEQIKKDLLLDVGRRLSKASAKGAGTAAAGIAGLTKFTDRMKEDTEDAKVHKMRESNPNLSYYQALGGKGKDKDKDKGKDKDKDKDKKDEEKVAFIIPQRKAPRDAIY